MRRNLARIFSGGSSAGSGVNYLSYRGFGCGVEVLDKFFFRVRGEGGDQRREEEVFELVNYGLIGGGIS